MKLFRRTVDAEERIAVHRERTERSIAGLRWLMAGVVFVVAGVAGIAVSERRRRVATATADSATRDVVERGEWDGWRAGAEAFMLTPLYDEITELERQSPGRHARVLPLARQQELDAVLGEHFAEFAARLREVCPGLTPGDVKLCCLSLTGLSTFGRALCFGSTETNIVKQRKHKIKQKLTADPVGRRLFEFIFPAPGALS
jgi:hypothetical protein